MKLLTFKRPAVTLAVITMVLTMGGFAPTAAAATREHDDNAVIRGGTLTVEELKTKCAENQQGNVQAIFREFGIDNCTTALDGLVEGSVNSHNEVFVGSQKVATSAMTAGRQDISNSRGSSTPILNGVAFRRPPSVSFRSGSIPAFVKMDGDIFKYAVLKPCGNPVTATDLPSPPAPRPVTPVVATKESSFAVQKHVRKHGSSAWSKDVSVQRGNDLEYRVVVQNTGEIELKDVIFRDSLPSGITFVNASMRVDNLAQTHFGLNGVNIGSIPTGAERTVVYKAVVTNAAEACGDDRLINRARVKPEGLTEKHDEARVEVCVPTPAPQQPEPEPEMPVTGISEVALVFVGAVTVGGAMAHRVYATAMRRI